MDTKCIIATLILAVFPLSAHYFDASCYISDRFDDGSQHFFAEVEYLAWFANQEGSPISVGYF